MFTLVRHNLWTAPQFPLFRRGLEPRAINPETADLIGRLGGVVLNSLDEAWDAAEGFMYPSGDMTRPADPAGIFRELPFLRLPLFVPAFSEDLIAA